MAVPGNDRDRWVAQIAALEDRSGSRAGRVPITRGRIVQTAFDLVQADGFDALTMRRVAAALQTGPASLYAHVRNKAELDDLLIGELCRRVALPKPDPQTWREQFVDVCRLLRDEYLRYPGVSRAALSASPRSLDALALSEGLLSILLIGGVEAQAAAWAIDAAYLYVSSYSLEASLRRRSADGSAEGDERVLDREEIAARLGMLPADRFPSTVAHVSELTSGDEHERFDFTLELLLQGLTAPPLKKRARG